LDAKDYAGASNRCIAGAVVLPESPNLKISKWRGQLPFGFLDKKQLEMEGRIRKRQNRGVIVEKVFLSFWNLAQRGRFEGRGFDAKGEPLRHHILRTATSWAYQPGFLSGVATARAGSQCYDHAEPRSWRHMDIFGKQNEIICTLPRGAAGNAAHYRVTAPWEGEGKHLTKDFEAFCDGDHCGRLTIKEREDIIGGEN